MRKAFLFTIQSYRWECISAFQIKCTPVSTDESCIAVDGGFSLRLYLATRFVEMHCTFLSFLLRESTRTLHQVSRKARMLACLTFFLPLGVPPSRLFSPFLPFFFPVTRGTFARRYIFALKYSYVMRCRVIRRVIRTAAPFLIFRTRTSLFAFCHVVQIIRTIVRGNLSRLRIISK